MFLNWADGNGGRKLIKLSEDYVLPTASAFEKGGVKIGNGLVMDGETLHAMILGGLSVGRGFLIDDGVFRLDPNAYFAGVLDEFPESPQAGCMAIVGDVPYLFNGADWLPINDYSDFVGATENLLGARGLVPEPAAGQHNKILRGDGSWGLYLLGTESSTLEGAMWLSTTGGD